MRLAPVKTRRNIYIALEDLNMDWTVGEIGKSVSLWLQGYSIHEISNQLDRDPDDLVVLIIDFEVTLRGYNFFLARKNGVLESPPVTMSYHVSKKFQRFLSENKKGYTALTNAIKVNFFWDENEFRIFRTLWNSGASIQTIAKKFKRSELDIVLLILDRARNGYIAPRKDGLEGWSEVDVKKTGGRRNRNKSKVS